MAQQATELKKVTDKGWAAVQTGYNDNDQAVWEVVKVGALDNDGGTVEIRFVNGDWFTIPAYQLDYVWKADMSGFIRHGYVSPEFP